MQKQTVKIACGSRKNRTYQERDMLTYRGLGVHQEHKGQYTITHIESGYFIWEADMLQRDARKIVKQSADSFDWSRSMDELLQDPNALKEARNHIKQLWIER